MKHIGFGMTYNCTSKCRHCRYRAFPAKDGVMRLEDVKRYLREFDDLEVASFGGGEPFLYPELLIASIKEATRLEILGWIITNGFWGENESMAKKYAKGVKDAGLDKLYMSVDAFHQEFVPFDAVRGAIRAAKEVGIEPLQVVGITLVDINDVNPFDQQTKRAKEALSIEFGIEMGVYPVESMGRAVDEFAEYFPMLPLTAIPSSGRCRQERDDGSIVDLRDREVVNVHSGGLVQLCAGITIGDARKTSIRDIVEAYDYRRRHPLLSVFLDKGYKGVLELAMEKGYKPLEGYASKCHVCFAARRFLRPFYPDVLAPAHVYEEQRQVVGGILRDS